MIRSLIVAVAQNGTIGDRNALLWHISEDLRHFRRLTSGHPVIMGRRTFESLGRPLPGRTNIVVSRTLDALAGCRTVRSLDEAWTAAEAEAGAAGECFVIGGAQLYAAALPVADRLYLTVVEHPYEGDTRFPDWDRAAWELEAAERFPCGAAYPHPFRFERYRRR